MRVHSSCAFGIALALAAPVSASPQCFVQSFHATSTSPGDRFGSDVDGSGDRIVVGAAEENLAGPDSGAAFVFERQGSTWVETAVLTAGDAFMEDELGARVAIDGDTVLASAQRVIETFLTQTFGAVYVFEYDGTAWSEAAKLEGSLSADFDQFGRTLAFEGDTAFIGASRATVDGLEGAGLVYVFERVGGVWFETAILTPAVSQEDGRFGDGIDILGDRALITASGYDGENSVGAGFLYERVDGEWVEVDRLLNSPGAAVSGPPLLTEEFAFVRAGIGSGTVTAFRELSNGWVPVAQLTPSDTTGAIEFGASMTAIGRTLMVGAPYGDSASTFDVGAVYTYEVVDGSWTEIAKLTAPDGVEDARFGGSVAATGDQFLIASWLDDDAGYDSGSVYAVTASPEDCPDLVGIPDELDLFADGTQWLLLNAGPEHAGLTHFVLGSASGTSPGITQGAIHLPLNLDFHFLLLLTSPNLLVSNSLGFLDEEGRATAALAFAPGEFDPAFLGLQLHHAYVVLNGALSPVYASSAVPVRIAATGQPSPGPDSACLETTLFAESGQSIFADFHTAIAMSEDRLLSGASSGTQSGTTIGVAYVYERQGGDWVQAAELTAADASPGKIFGSSVDIDGDVAVVGAYGDDEGAADSGAAYVFERVRGVWGQTAKLKPEDSFFSDMFGYSVSVKNGRILVGSIEDNTAGFNAGSAYLYEKEGADWVQVQELTASDSDFLDLFGFNVECGEDALFVTKFVSFGGLVRPVYVFEQVGDTWVETAHLTGSLSMNGSQFGERMAASGFSLAVLERVDQSVLGNPGAIYVFDRVDSVWTETAKFSMPFNGPEVPSFTIATAGDLAYDGDRIAAGKHWSVGHGSIYAYQRQGNDWIWTHEFVSPEVPEFRRVIDLSSGVLGISANSFVSGGEGDAVFLYSLSGDGCP